jgi:hypothetical protein
MAILGYTLAVLIGLSLGLLGGGGSVLAVPVLVYVMGVDTKQAVPMSLAVVGAVSLVGMITHWQKGNIVWSKVITLGGPAMVGAFIGAKIGAILDPLVQMTLFGVAMIVAAYFMIKRSSLPQAEKYPEPELTAEPSSKYRLLGMMAEGFGVGVLTGMVGVGGGFAIVPALVLLGKVPMKKAIGTSLLIIAGKSASGFVGYLGTQTLDWAMTVSFAFLAGVGTVIGAYLAHYISAKHLQRGFGYFLLGIAALVIAQNYYKWQNSSSARPSNSQYHLPSSFGKAHR